jgi:hypothetical protein
MIKKRHLIALGAFSAALGACGSSDMQGPAGGTGAMVGTGTGGSGTGATGSGGTSGKGSGGTGTGGSGTGATGSGATGSGATGGTGTGGTGTGGSAAGGAGGSGAATCVPGTPATSQFPRMLNRMYDNAVRDLLGVTAMPDGSLPSEGLFTDFDGPMTADAWRLYQDVGAKIASAVMSGPNKTKFISCDPSAANCLSQTISAFGRKAFRRAMTPDEVSNFQTKLSSTNPAGTPAQIAEAALFAFLVSPSFLLIPEVTATTKDASGAFALSSTEVAARLSFLLWNSVPDDELNAAADANMLTTKDQILAQATRMLQVKDKAGSMIADFHRVAWANDNNTATSHWWKMDHDGNALYNSALKSTYRDEINMFFQDVAFSGGSFKDLFLSPTAFVTKDTAAIYGLNPSDYDGTLKKVTLDANQRPGFMTRIGFLSSYAHPDETSPILRGAFVTVHMIGLDPGPPSPDAANKTVPAGTYLTNRAKVTALVEQDNACKGCHDSYINPPGFVLENYDSIGKWQTVDPLSGPIDPVATVSFSADDIRDVHNAKELMDGITQTPTAAAIYATAWVSYAFGRNPNNNDQCIVDQINQKLSGDGYSVLQMIADVTQADSFRVRVQATP